jgi:hypothetical protein
MTETLKPLIFASVELNLSQHHMKKASIIILITGLLITIVTGVSFATREKVLDIGKLEVNANVNHTFSWSPMMGVVVMAIGAAVYLLAPKKN